MNIFSFSVTVIVILIAGSKRILVADGGFAALVILLTTLKDVG